MSKPHNGRPNRTCLERRFVECLKKCFITFFYIFCESHLKELHTLHSGWAIILGEFSLDKFTCSDLTLNFVLWLELWKTVFNHILKEIVNIKITITVLFCTIFIDNHNFLIILLNFKIKLQIKADRIFLILFDSHLFCCCHHFKKFWGVTSHLIWDKFRIQNINMPQINGLLPLKKSNITNFLFNWRQHQNDCAKKN